ncbi:hypothetical protein K458DRAFT_274706, partial [Lentithecium fluviatile CBS 122367]
VPHIRCVACLDFHPVENTITLECEPQPHVYCRACLLDLFEASIGSDASLFPPRCCKKPVSLDLCRQLLPKEEVKKFDMRIEEITTKDPIYCSSPHCAQYIQKRMISSGIARCLVCNQRTCAVCKAEEHQDQLCPDDEGTKMLKDQAKKERWQECTSCKNLVELTAGCFHITCRCSHQFCYLCGAPWKQCPCPQMDE